MARPPIGAASRLRAFSPILLFALFGAAGTLSPFAASATRAATGSSGLVAAYAFDEGSGTAAADASGNANSGTITGATWSTAGKSAGALSFNGTSNYVQVPDSPSIDLTTGMTLEAWVKPTALGTAWRTVLFKTQTAGMVYSLYANQDATRPVGQVNIGGEVNAVGPAALPVSAWSHLAATFDGGALRTYLNGSLVATAAVTGSIPTSAGALRMGGNSIWGEWFAGLIDDVRVYNRALSGAEIQTDMTTPVGGVAPVPPTPAPSTPVASYSFDQGSGTTTPDASGNGNTGTISNGTWTTAGEFGGALSFNGTSSVVTIADAPELDLASAMTLEAWIKPSDVSFWEPVLVKEQVGDLVYGSFAGSDTGVPTGQVYSGAQQIVRGSSALPLNVWSHLTTTYDGATQRVYLNGTLVGSRAQTGSMPASAGVLRIGGTTLWPNEWFKGLIDEVRVYNRALTATQIQTDMNTSVGGSAPPPPPPPPPSGDTTAPTVPSNLTRTSTTQTSLAVSWTASTDNVGVASYGAYRDGALVSSSSATSATFGGLACGTTYTLGVDAVDAAGNHSARASISAATAACSPPPPPPPPPPAGTASVFISTSGSDANPCTATARCLSFDRAYRVALPGQIVEVAAGSYSGQSIGVDASKTSTADVLIRPAAGASVSVGQLTLNGKHFELRDFTVNGDANFSSTASDETLRNLTIRGGIFILSSQQISVIGGSVGPGQDYHPMITSEWLNNTPPRDILIDGVYFHDWSRSGPDIHTECLQIGGGDRITVRNSLFHNCAVMDMHVSWYGDAPMTKNVTIENNRFETTTSGGYYTIGAYGYENLLIRNNSFAQEFAIFQDSAGAQGPFINVRVIGNVGPRTAWACESRVTFRYNVWDGVTCGSTDLNAPTNFVNPGAGDFHLRAGAAAIDRGDPTSYPPTDAEGRARPQGAGPDAGAYEAG